MEGVNYRTHPEYWGYYDNPYEAAVHDPGNTVPCLICGLPWTSDTVRTISAMPVDAPSEGVKKSYFYRVHRTCHNALDDAGRERLDGLLLDYL
jgi:hypothetical protein